MNYIYFGHFGVVVGEFSAMLDRVMRVSLDFFVAYGCNCSGCRCSRGGGKPWLGFAMKR